MVIVLIVAVVAIYLWWKLSHYNDSEWVKNRIKGRSEAQANVIRYFCNDDACLCKKTMSDAEYDEKVKAVLNSTDYRQKAMDAIGLDEDQVKEIEPVRFEGFKFDNDALFKQGKDGKFRSSKYEVSWLFFSATQVYLYQNTFNMDEIGAQESTLEYFYKDVTAFSTSADTVESQRFDSKTQKTIIEKIHTNRFAMTVPGDKCYCSMEQSDNVNRAIQGMKSLLREKKNS